MIEKPNWLQGVHEGGKKDPEDLTEAEALEFTAMRQVFLDEAPDDWQQQIKPDDVSKYRTEIMSWSRKELMSFCRDHYAWDGDPSFTKALIDVIGGMTISALSSEEEAKRIAGNS